LFYSAKGVPMTDKNKNKKKDNKNILLVTIFISSMLLFLLGTVVFVSNQVANCSSVKKARNMCLNIDKPIKIKRVRV